MTMGSLAAHGKAGLLNSLEDYFRKAHELGYDCLAVGVGSLPSLDEKTKMADFKALVSDLGMGVQVGGKPDQEESFEVANCVGSPVVGTALKGFRIRFRENWDEAQARDEMAKDIERLQGIEKLARKHGVPVTFENHGGYRTDELCELLQAVDSPYIGINLDTANQIVMVEDTVECCRALAPRVFSTHIKDTLLVENAGGAGAIWCVPGEGINGLPEQARLLREAGNDFIVTLEFLDHFVVPIPYRTDEFWQQLGRTREQNAACLRMLEEAPKLPEDPRPTELEDLVPYEAETRQKSLHAMKRLFGDE
jgi:sugar phosphate isomerase/epimerase